MTLEGSQGEPLDERDRVDEDAALMLAYGQGDAAAFDRLFARWGGRLLAYLQRMVSDAATAEELVQETFLRVHGARDRYAVEARFSTWLYRIGTNLALNELRRPRRKRPHASTDEDGAIPLVARSPGPERQTQARREVDAVTRELGRLPERQRMALWLSAVEGLSYAEIARALETSDKSVKSLVHRARATLVERMPQGRSSAVPDDSRDVGEKV